MHSLVFITQRIRIRTSEKCEWMRLWKTASQLVVYGATRESFSFSSVLQTLLPRVSGQLKQMAYKHWNKWTKDQKELNRLKSYHTLGWILYFQRWSVVVDWVWSKRGLGVDPLRPLCLGDFAHPALQYMMFKWKSGIIKLIFCLFDIWMHRNEQVRLVKIGILECEAGDVQGHFSGSLYSAIKGRNWQPANTYRSFGIRSNSTLGWGYWTHGCFSFGITESAGEEILTKSDSWARHVGLAVKQYGFCIEPSIWNSHQSCWRICR